MTPTLAEGDHLCTRMQRVRNRMHAQADVLRVEAQNLLDWRCYVAQYPWTCLAVAAVFGFWLTPGPRVMSTVKLAEDSMDELAKRSALQSDLPRRTESWLRPLGGFALSLATKALAGYVSRQLLANHSPRSAAPSESVA